MRATLEDIRLLAAADHATLLATYYPVVLERCRLRLPDPDAWEVAQRVARAPRTARAF